MSKKYNKKTLREVVEREGKLLLVPEMIPIIAEPAGDIFSMIYNVKAHYKDNVEWDEGERETLFKILAEGIRFRKLKAFNLQNLPNLLNFQLNL